MVGMPDTDEDGDEEGGNFLDQIFDMAGAAQSKVSRSTDDDCDHCGTSEGSTVHFRESDCHLCRECYNDPEVIGEYV